MDGILASLETMFYEHILKILILFGIKILFFKTVLFAVSIVTGLFGQYNILFNIFIINILSAYNTEFSNCILQEKISTFNPIKIIK